MSKEKKEPGKPVLTEAHRVARVFASQGRATRLADHLSDAHRKRVAALCDQHGTILPQVTKEFAKILREIINEQKAVVKGLEEVKPSVPPKP